MRLHGFQNGEHIAQRLAATGGRKQDNGVVTANRLQHFFLHGVQGLDTQGTKVVYHNPIKSESGYLLNDNSAISLGGQKGADVY